MKPFFFNKNQKIKSPIVKSPNYSLLIINYSLFTILYSLLIGCSPKSNETQKPLNLPLTHSVIFLDKSISVNLNENFVKNKYTGVLQEIIQNNIQQKGDKIELWFIHENTPKGKVMTLMARTEKPDLAGMNATDREFAQGNYEADIQRERTIFLQKIAIQFDKPNTSSSKKETDVLATLTILNNIALQSAGEVKAYYFSDMIESVNAKGRRDFESNPPRNTAEAETWAGEDAKKLTEQLSNLSGLSVQLILPFEPTSTSRQNNPTITDYWKKLMGDLGILDIEEK